MRKKGLASLLTAVTLAAGMVTAVPVSAAETAIEPAAIASIGGWYSGSDGDRAKDFHEIRLGGTDTGVVKSYNDPNRNASSADCKVTFLRFNLEELQIEDDSNIFLTLYDGRNPGNDREGKLNIYAAVAETGTIIIDGETPVADEWNTTIGDDSSITWYTRPSISDPVKVASNFAGTGTVSLNVTDIFEDVPSGSVTIALLGEYSDTAAEYVYDRATLSTSKIETTVVAKIGDTEYTSLGAAMNAGAGKTVTVLADTELDASSEKDNYSGGKNSTMTVSGENGEKTITMINEEKELLIWDGFVFNNINFVSKPDSIVKSLAKAQNNNKQGTLKMNNSSVKNVSFDSYLSGFGSLNFTDTEIIGNSTTTDVFLARNSGSLTNATITGNTANGGRDSVIYLTNKDTNVVFNVTNSKINGNTAAYDIEIVPINNHSVTVNLAGSTQVGKISNTSVSGGSIVLKNDFTGSAKITPASTSVDTVVATVEEGALTSGITVDGLDTDTYVLKVQDGQLVIAEKTPAFTPVDTTKITVEGIEGATENSDAVGYYAGNVEGLSGNLKDYDWLITMNDDVQFTKKVNIDTTVNTEGGVSFGIILYGKTSADADSYSTADIKTVQLTKID